MTQQKDMTITVLCENSVASSIGLTGEHGWAVGIESSTTRMLFDTGQGLGITNNAQLLDFDLRRLDRIVLSHGHYDHCSGLPRVLPLTGEINVHLHTQSFGYRCSRSDQKPDREIGILHTKESLEALGAHFYFNDDFCAIAEGIYLSGEIPRCNDFEQQDPQLLRTGADGNLTQDPHVDDQTLIIDSKQGLILILGCAHAGIINILTHVKQQLPGRPIHTIIGGTHLGFASDEQFAATVKSLQTFNIQCLATAHCTGLKRGAELANIYGNRFRFTPVGTRIHIP